MPLGKLAILSSCLTALALAQQGAALPSYNIYTLAGNGTAAFADSPSPMLYLPAGVGYDSAGQALYVADQANNRIRKVQFQVGSQGPQNVVVTTAAGTGFAGQACQASAVIFNPPPASEPAGSATINGPTSVAADGQGNIYVADTGNDCVRQFSGSTLIRYAGNGQGAYAGDGGDPKQAAVADPLYLAFYQESNLLISSDGVVRLVVGGEIQTVAGGGLTNPDSPGQHRPTDVQLGATGIASDASNNKLYVNSGGEIFVVSGGFIQKFAGGGNSVANRDVPATSLQLEGPTALAVDLQGNLLIAEACAIRRVTPAGIADVIAGIPGTCGFSGDSSPLAPGPATLATLYGPRGLAVDSAGNIYIADTNNNRIRVLVPSGASGPPAQPGKLLGDCSNKYGNSQGPCSPSAGDPINIATGNVFYAVSDYQTANANRLGFARYYNSRGDPNTLAKTLGTNWRSTYDRYIRIASATSILLERADGQTLAFTLNGNTWTTDTDVDLELTQAGSTWTLTDARDNIETYVGVSPTEALLSSIQTRDGYTQTLAYDAGNRLISVTDSFGLALSLAYANGLLQTVTTPDGLVLTYGYTSSGQLVPVSYSTTPVTSQSYVYENTALPFALTGIIDEDGNRYATWTYDASARGLSSQRGAGADQVTVAYNDSDGSRVVAKALGQQDTYQYATLQGVPKVTEIDRAQTTSTASASSKFTYDINGYLSSETDWNGNLTSYLNDLHGQPINIAEAWDTPMQRATAITYHPNYHLPVKIVQPGLTTAFAYDAGGNLLTRTQTDTASTNGQTRTWTYTWADGLLTSVQNPRTDVTEVTQLTYDNSGALVSTTNALGQTVNITAHLPGGLPQTVVDANGVVTQFVYDARLRLLSGTVTTAAGPLTTTFTYDPAGNLVSITLPDGSSLSNSYDTAHRLTQVTDLFGQQILYALDALADVTQAAVTGATGQVQYQHTANFDALGRVLQSVGGVGQTTTYTYDANGNALTITDPLNRVTRQGFDALNRVVKITDAAQGVTGFSYDAEDRPLTVTDANGNTTTYSYDGLGDLVQLVSPDTGTTVYTYDADGNLVRKVDAGGAIANYAYDALDRVISATYPADPAENVTYTYDEPDYGFSTGRLTTLTDAAGTLHRSYDERGNVLTEARTIGDTTLLTSYTYDAASRIASIAYPSGWQMAYARDAMGRVSGITAQAPGGAQPVPVISNVSYQPLGPVSAWTWGNGASGNRTFDLDYRLTSLADSGDSGANLLQSLGYAYNAANNVLSVSDGVTPGNNQSFQYDALDRLTGAAGGYGTFGYTYDSVGNRLTQTAGSANTTYSYAPHNNQLTSVATNGAMQAVTYTKTGNINSFSPAAGSVGNLVYNQRGQLAGAMAGQQQVAQYTYDGFGQRLAKAGSSTTLYQYDLGGHLLEETDGEGNALADYVYLGNLPIASISPAAGQVYYLHSDRLGTPQVATNANQAVAWMASYQPFGTLNSVPGLIVQDLRFPGQENDSDTGWYHNGFRNYIPSLGRYIESDFTGLAGGANTYAYASGNPARYIDPFGLDDCTKVDYFSASTNSSSSGSPGPSALTPLLQGFATIVNFAQQHPFEAALVGTATVLAIAATDGTAGPSLLAFEGAGLGGETTYLGAGAVGGGLLIGGLENGTTLFRAVGPAELADIQATGVLRNLGSAEGKYFTTTPEAASSYAKQAVSAFGDPPYTLIKTSVPNSIFEGLTPATVDRGIPAWVIPNGRLAGLTPQVLNSMPIVY